MSEPVVLLIGTGPPMLIEGLIRATARQKVVFVDKASGLGGSWKCPDILGHKGVEVGVHLIENRPHLNRVFEALIPPSERMDCALDMGLWNGRRIPMKYARICLYCGIAGRNLFRGNFDRVRHSIKNAGEAIRYGNVPFIYPKQGMAQVLTMIEQRLIELGATFHFDRVVSEIDATGPKVLVETDAGSMCVDQLVMSSRAHAQIEGFDQFWPNANGAALTSVVLKTNRHEPLFEGYVEIINDPVLKRVRNITAFTDLAPDAGVALIVAQLRSSIDETPPDGILGHLIKLGLLKTGTQILQHHVDAVRLNTLPDKALDLIKASYPEKIRVLRSVDLGDSRFDGATNVFENL